jgi:hypothetical protein
MSLIAPGGIFGFAQVACNAFHHIASPAINSAPASPTTSASVRSTFPKSLIALPATKIAKPAMTNNNQESPINMVFCVEWTVAFMIFSTRL